MAFLKRQTANVSTRLLVPCLTLMLSVLALVLVGLVMVYSTSSVTAISEGASSSHYIVRQLIWVAVGIFLATVVYHAIPRYAWATKFVWIPWGVCMVMLVLVPLIGTEIFGAKRWLGVGEFTIQPSEFIKISLLLTAAHILYRSRINDIEGKAAAFQIMLCVVIPALFLFKTQSDLGTTAIIAIGVIAVLWLGDVPLKWILVIGAVGVLFVIYSIIGTDYRAGRLVFLDPWDDGLGGYGDGYNIIRSYYAIAEGGVFGVGLGNSHEKYQYLFAPESDFIFAIIAEELGLIGSLLVIALFLVFLASGLAIAHGADDDLGRMIAGGCTIMIAFQAFLNIGCVIGVFPTTGKPLPFVSMGGSSMMASMIMVGLILSIAKDGAGGASYERRRDDLRVVRAYDVPAPSRYGNGPYASARSDARSAAPHRGQGPYRSQSPYRPGNPLAERYSRGGYPASQARRSGDFSVLVNESRASGRAPRR